MQEFTRGEVYEYLCKFKQILTNMKNRMFANCPSDSITDYFIKCMIPHHEAAIYMCQNLLKYTDYKPLIDIANNIIITQTNGIKEMKQIEASNKYLNSKNDIRLYTNKYLFITKNMIYKMSDAKKCCNINLNFINEMIPHHEGAVEMCNNLLKYDINPKLVIVAKDIIKEQSEGIKMLMQSRCDICKNK